MASEREEGLTALQRGDFPAAAGRLEAAIAQDANDFQAHLYLGGVYHQLKRYGDAARVLTQATELEPANPQARFNLGIAREQSGDLTGARAAFEQAILLQAEYPVAHEALERVQARLNGPFGSLDAPPSANVEALSNDDGDVSRPVFSKPVRSSFGSVPPVPSSAPDASSGSESAPAPVPPAPAASDYTPTSSASPAFLPGYGASNYGAPPASNAPGYGQGETPGSSAPPPPYGAAPYPPPPPPPYGPSYPPGNYGPVAPPYGQPPPAAPPGPYGTPPYGAGYAPPGVYGYGGAQQYTVVTRPVPQEATVALVLSVLGLMTTCLALGVVVCPISLFLALKARRMMQTDPYLGGQGQATAAIWLSAVGLVLNVLALIAFFFAMFAGM